MSPEELELRPVSKFIEIAEHIGELLGFYSDHGDPDGDDSPIKQARECREEAMKLAWKLEPLVSQSVEFALEMDLNADAVNQHLGSYSSMIRNFGDWGSVEQRDEWGGYANRIVWQGPTFDELREGCIALKREPLFLTLLKAEPRKLSQTLMMDGAREPPQYVTLDQMAALVNRSKKTLERLKKANKLPPPEVQGGGGKPDEWLWCNVREDLAKEYDRVMPERYPSQRNR